MKNAIESGAQVSSDATNASVENDSLPMGPSVRIVMP
jgi:hypothetical protein